jgi:pimeloyl-ACP methyl ester carboxylesterase
VRDALGAGHVAGGTGGKIADLLGWTRRDPGRVEAGDVRDHPRRERAACAKAHRLRYRLAFDHALCRVVPNLMAAMVALARRGRIEAPYLLQDMAADAVGLLDALELEAAHVVGASLGGMIAQTLAIEHPSRVRTVTSIMSTTGDPDLPWARPEAIATVMSPAPADRAGSIERAVRVFRAIGSPGFPFDEARVRRRAGLAYDRCSHPAGAVRQLLAILASGSRKEALRSVAAPTLVIHGSDDPLVPLAGGLATAEAIPGAELLIIDGIASLTERARG